MGPVKVAERRRETLTGGGGVPAYGCATRRGERVQCRRARSANLIDTAQVTPRGGRRVVHRSRVESLIKHALRKGAVRHSLGTFSWDVSADCERPVVLELEGRENPGDRTTVRKPGGRRIVHHANVWVDLGERCEVHALPPNYPLGLILEVPCRRCRACLSRRAAHWRLRAEAEINAAPRTWFGTLTLSPEARARAIMEAEATLSRGGSRYGDLSPREQFAEQHRVISKEITRWLKRIRKESEATLRYCLVAEAHKSGDPHYHCLIHEVFSTECVGERTLRGQWLLGFSKWNLVRDKRASAYVTKYLSKAALARVRASIGYGNTALAIDTPEIKVRSGVA